MTGYRGSNAARLAMQQKEINFYSESPPSYRTVVTQSLVAKGDAIGLFYDPGWDGKTFTRSKQVDGLPIKSFPELYREIKGSDPKGPLWETYLTALQLTGEVFRVAVMPPGSPKAAVDAMRAAIRALGSDKEFAEEAHEGVQLRARVRGRRRYRRQSAAHARHQAGAAHARSATT